MNKTFKIAILAGLVSVSGAVMAADEDGMDFMDYQPVFVQPMFDDDPVVADASVDFLFQGIMQHESCNAVLVNGGVGGINYQQDLAAEPTAPPAGLSIIANHNLENEATPTMVVTAYGTRGYNGIGPQASEAVLAMNDTAPRYALDDIADIPLVVGMNTVNMIVPVGFEAARAIGVQEEINVTAEVRCNIAPMHIDNPGAV